MDIISDLLAEDIKFLTSQSDENDKTVLYMKEIESEVVMYQQ